LIKKKETKVASPISWIKLQILNHLLSNVSVKEIADFIEAYGENEFGQEKDRYLDSIRAKLANLVFEISKRIKRRTNV
jgi:hypothetical protein